MPILNDMKNYLITFAFHGIFCNEDDERLNLVDPLWHTTVSRLRQFIEEYLEKEFIFISPEDILYGLDDSKNYILLTFDDGYSNNQNVLSLSKEYKIPAIFFISTDFVKFNKSFWWDILYRERRRRGLSNEEILRENLQLKSKTYDEIEKYLKLLFGRKAFRPKGDIDRPFTPSELTSFAKERYVFLGNHTSDHSKLTSLSSREIEDRIRSAQDFLHDITKIKPLAISYPYGDYSDEVIDSAKRLGLKLGFAVGHGKTYLPISSYGDYNMRLNRFYLSEE